MLKLSEVHTHYGHVHVLKGVSLELRSGEIVSILGANGAGKTTTLKTILGLVPASGGEIFFEDQSIRGLLPYNIVSLGIALVPEGRKIFPDLTVHENLMMGSYIRRDKNVKEDLEYIFSIFPKLKERKLQRGGTLSGGEQQMLAIGRALMSKARLLMMDEPSMGLAPIMREEIFRNIIKINRDGTSILLVEQNAALATAVSHRGYVLETGIIVFSGTANELSNNEELARAYLGKK